MKKEYTATCNTATCNFAGWDTGKYDAQGRLILSQEEPKKGQYKPTSIDTDKKNADFLLIRVGAKPVISWRGGKIERLKSRKALAKLQKVYSWETDF